MCCTSRECLAFSNVCLDGAETRKKGNVFFFLCGKKVHPQPKENHVIMYIYNIYALNDYCNFSAEREKEAGMEEDEPAPKGDRTPSSSKQSVRVTS